MKEAKEILFSIVVPVYNRRDEVADLLRSLESQTDKGFEIILRMAPRSLRCLMAKVRKVSGLSIIRNQMKGEASPGIMA